MMLQQDEPSDYVIGMGEQYSVRKFVELSFAHKDIEIVYVLYVLLLLDMVFQFLDTFLTVITLMYVAGKVRTWMRLEKTRRLGRLSFALILATFAPLRYFLRIILVYYETHLFCARL